MSPVLLDPRVANGCAWGDQHLGLGYWRPFNCGDRFGHPCSDGTIRFDCTGWTTEFDQAMGQKFGSLPLNSADMARWCEGPGAKYRLAVEAAKSVIGSTLIFGGINGYGPAGHAVKVGPGRLSYESSGHRGTSRQSLDRLGWSHAFVPPAIANALVVVPPKPPEEEEMFRIIKGDQSAELFVTNWLEKRKLTTPAEATAVIRAGVTNGVGTVLWPQAWVDAIPLKIDMTPNSADRLVFISDIVKNVNRKVAA